MIALRDFVRVERDNSAAGAETPQWESMIPELPCLITDLGGAETYRGRQVEATVTHVVRTSFNEEFGRLTATLRLVVLEDSYGTGPRMLNVESVRIVRAVGKDHFTELYCRSLD